MPGEFLAELSFTLTLTGNQDFASQRTSAPPHLRRFLVFCATNQQLVPGEEEKKIGMTGVEANRRTSVIIMQATPADHAFVLNMVRYTATRL
jgi:hypothetical protein